MTNQRRFRSRSGFTLTELMVAITVIAILAGFLVPVVISSLRTAKEATVVMEMKQLDMAMDSFQAKFHFVPPSFESGIVAGQPVGISNPQQLLRYLNKLSPNHQELTQAYLNGPSRLVHWWTEIGQYLDQESSLVFWLSGVCANRQYPLTGGVQCAPGVPPLAAHDYGPLQVERNVFYEFKKAQIFGNDDDEIVKANRSGANVPFGYVVDYLQPHFGQDGDEIEIEGFSQAADYRFKYRDSLTYNLGGVNCAYYEGPSNGDLLNEAFLMNNRGLFANPKGYQIIGFGMDGLAGVPGNWNAVNNTTQGWGPAGEDNVCNFADGRLSKWVINNE